MNGNGFSEEPPIQGPPEDHVTRMALVAVCLCVVMLVAMLGAALGWW